MCMPRYEKGAVSGLRFSDILVERSSVAVGHKDTQGIVFDDTLAQRYIMAKTLMEFPVTVSANEVEVVYGV